MCVYIYIHVFYMYMCGGIVFSHDKEGSLPFVKTWMKLEGIC